MPYFSGGAREEEEEGEEEQGKGGEGEGSGEGPQQCSRYQPQFYHTYIFAKEHPSPLYVQAHMSS